MPTVSLTQALRTELEYLFHTCVIRAARTTEVERTVDRLLAGKARYQAAGGASGIPWHFLAVLHNLESGLDFKTHLHNGDPLTARTVQAPRGRPKSGEPPYTWEESAADALAMKSLGASTDWSLAGTLYELERYNGFGYRLHHPEVLTPYLWSASDHYTSGKYVADGTWSHTAVSRQIGAAVLMRRMAERREIEFEDRRLPAAAEDRPLVPSWSTRKPRNAEMLQRAETLQRWLNTYPGIFLKVDGVVADRTSDAYKLVTGSLLPGDPRS